MPGDGTGVTWSLVWAEFGEKDYKWAGECITFGGYAHYLNLKDTK